MLPAPRDYFAATEARLLEQPGRATGGVRKRRPVAPDLARHTANRIRRATPENPGWPAAAPLPGCRLPQSRYSNLYLPGYGTGYVPSALARSGAGDESVSDSMPAVRSSAQLSISS